MVRNIAIQIEQALHSTLGKEADVLAREVRFMQRQRKLTGSAFAQMLVWGSLDQPAPSYTDLAQDAGLLGVPISPQGIEQRFSPEAAQFMQQLLERVVEQVITGINATVVPLLQRFNGLYIRDSSVVTLPEALQEIWPGCGGSQGGKAALKLQVRFNYTTGQLEGPTLQAGRQHDRMTPYGPEAEPAGSLALADLGYFNLLDLRQRHDQGQYFLCRHKVGTALYTPEGERIDLLRWLQGVTTQTERLVQLGSQARIPVRLLVYPVPQEVVDQRRRRRKEYARKKGVTPTQETLRLCEWTLLLTNVPAEMLSLEEAPVLAGVRWQVEVLFRVWKSHARIDEWRSQNPWRILCELYAKLIGLVFLHWMLLTEWHRSPDRSLWKAAKALQKLTLPLALALRRGEGLQEIVALFQACLRTAGRTNKRRSKPATFQQLFALHGLT